MRAGALRTLGAPRVLCRIWSVVFCGAATVTVGSEIPSATKIAKSLTGRSSMIASRVSEKNPPSRSRCRCSHALVFRCCASSIWGRSGKNYEVVIILEVAKSLGRVIIVIMLACKPLGRREMAALSPQRLSKLIGAIYDGVLDHSTWEQTFVDVKGTLDCQTAIELLLPH